MKNKLKTLFERLKRFRKTAVAAVCSLSVVLMSAVPASAAGLQDSEIVKGTEKLIGDVTTWLMVLAPVVAGMLIIYFCIRRAAADEVDQKKWNNRIVVAVVSCIGAVPLSCLIVAIHHNNVKISCGGCVQVTEHSSVKLPLHAQPFPLPHDMSFRNNSHNEPNRWDHNLLYIELPNAYLFFCKCFHLSLT